MITEAKGNYGVALTFLTTFHGEMGEDRRISTQRIRPPIPSSTATLSKPVRR